MPWLRINCLSIASATPIPFCDRCCDNCWSIIDVKVAVSCESNGPSCGVASRMLLSIICVKTASNCCAATFMPACGDAFACALSFAKPCTSSAKRWLRSFAAAAELVVSEFICCLP